MTDPHHAAEAHEAHGNQLGPIGSQEAVTVVTLSVTFGILALMGLLFFMSHIM
jgi:hypothetical protein